MRKVRLARLMAGDETQELVSAIAAIDESPLAVKDEVGEILWGKAREGDLEYPVLVDGEVIGLVSGRDEKALSVATLLNQMARRELDNSLQAQETLNKIEEIKEFYELAGQASAALDHRHICSIVKEEVKRTLSADHVEVSLKEEKFEGCTMEESQAGSCISAELRVNGATIGYVRAEIDPPRRFSAKDEDLLRVLATRVAAPIESARLYDRVNTVLQTIEELNYFLDVDTILDAILLEARKLANADAGSIFLRENNTLKFSYVHNDTLFTGDDANKAIYTDLTVPISEESIVGYAALTGRTVNIADAYNLSESLPYTFNSSFDKKTGYRTTSILAIPLTNYEDKLLGVMQIINAKDKNGESAPFSAESRTYMPLFANNAAVAIERGTMMRDMILRMTKLAELRNPNETLSHVQRVGAISGEIYNRWALNHKLDQRTIRRFRDMIRIASMLHDVGKVGTPDHVLKKKGKLSEEEASILKWHTVLGARLFAGFSTNLDKMCYEIVLNHHERWDGTGYPGGIDDVFAEKIHFGEPKKGEEIPLAARITALADAYDSLLSRRRDPWPEDKALAWVKQEAGGYFDPELVDVFFQILDVVRAIREKYK